MATPVVYGDQLYKQNGLSYQNVNIWYQKDYK